MIILVVLAAHEARTRPARSRILRPTARLRLTDLPARRERPDDRHRHVAASVRDKGGRPVVVVDGI